MMALPRLLEPQPVLGPPSVYRGPAAPLCRRGPGAPRSSGMGMGRASCLQGRRDLASKPCCLGRTARGAPWAPVLLRSARRQSCSALAGDGGQDPAPPLVDAGAEGGGLSLGLGEGGVALLLEVEGVMVDVHRVGHLEAFNSAFLAGGVPGVRWSTATYNALHRRTGGDNSAMLRVFFEGQQRWPKDGMDRDAQEDLLQQLLLLKAQALQAAVNARELPVRPGLADLLEEALASGCHIAAITAQARCGEDTARKLLRRLPQHLYEKVLVVGTAEVEGSLFWQVVGSQGWSPDGPTEDSLAAELSEAVAARKQLVAEQVSRALRVRAEVGSGGRGRQGAQGVAALRAACELLQAPLAKVLVLAGSQPMIQNATRAGIPSIAVRSSITAQAEFQGALQIYEDFGPGSLTLQRLFRRLGLDS